MVVVRRLVGKCCIAFSTHVGLLSTMFFLWRICAPHDAWWIIYVYLYLWDIKRYTCYIFEDTIRRYVKVVFWLNEPFKTYLFVKKAFIVLLQNKSNANTFLRTDNYSISVSAFIVLFLPSICQGSTSLCSKRNKHGKIPRSNSKSEMKASSISLNLGEWISIRY